MKKSIVLSVFVISMLNSCGTYTGTGTYGIILSTDKDIWNKTNISH